MNIEIINEKKIVYFGNNATEYRFKSENAKCVYFSLIVMQNENFREKAETLINKHINFINKENEEKSFEEKVCCYKMQFADTLKDISIDELKNIRSESKQKMFLGENEEYYTAAFQFADNKIREYRN